MTSRRLFHSLVAVALSGPLCVWGQQPARLPTVGILSDARPTACASGAPGHAVACTLDGLRALGYVEGRNLGVTLIRIEARNVSDLPQALAAVASSGADAIFMLDEATLAASGEVRKQVSEWALSRRLPVASPNASFAADGGLVSLGTDVPAVSRRAAFYVHRILGGAKPADLPVERPTIFKLSVNRKTAAALGLTIPQSLLLRADEVIQ